MPALSRKHATAIVPKALPAMPSPPMTPLLRRCLVRVLQVLVEEVHERVERLLLNRVRLVGAVGLPVDEWEAVHRMIEAHPRRVLAGLLHPLVHQLEDALLMIGLA